MTLDFWLKRQRVSYEDIIKKKNLKSYKELVEYSNSLNLIPPDESTVSQYFQEKESPRKGRSGNSVRNNVRSTKTVSSRNNSKRKSGKQKNDNSLRRGSKNEKKSKVLDNKKDRNGRDNSSGE